MKSLNIFFTVVFLLSASLSAQVTGLSGWNIFLDPGHSRDENMGIYGYSEAKKNLRVGLRLRELLSNTTDIDTVYMSRTNDQVSVTLSQRSSRANNLGAAWYHSIHSDAGATQYNSTLLMYGGWRSNGQTVEKIPHGGKAMSDIMVTLLTRGMRTTTRGNYADRTFYQGFPYNHANQWPYLHVNRETNMASELSEAGFHTNPTQNQRNMNAEWKKLEAYTFYWSILKYFGIARPTLGIATGIIRDIDNNVPINGATITINGQTYTTDTYASLFYQYSSNPDQLHNGFYFIENLPNSTLDMYVDAPGYYPDTLQVTIIDTFFTFKDATLVSSLNPFITYSNPADGDTNFSGYEPITISFSRDMNRTTVENSFSLNPPLTGTFNWSNDKNVDFTPDSIKFLTNYTLTLAATAEDIYGHVLDGDGDGTGGDDFVIDFKTGNADIFPPEIVTHYPNENQSDVDSETIINVLYDEELNDLTVTDDRFDLTSYKDLGNPVSLNGTLEHRVIKNQSLVSFYPTNELETDALHRINIITGFEDLLGNSGNSTKLYSLFTTADYSYNKTEIDDYEGGSVTSNWWQPSQSGSTTGINPATNRSENTDFVNLMTGSTTSLQIDYDWDVNAGSWLIREYLGGGPPRSVIFNTNYLLQVFIFGDGSGTKFRFAVDDNYPNTGASYHEVSTWYTVDWVGWRLVTWDLANDSVGTWLGNGVLENNLRFDSMQLAYEPGTDVSGTLYFDDLRIATKNVSGLPETAVENPVPTHYQLFQNYPNPFNPATIIKYQVPRATKVNISVYSMLGQHITTLVNEERSAGIYQVEFNTENLAAGIYLYTIEADGFRDSKKMMLVK